LYNSATLANRRRYRPARPKLSSYLRSSARPTTRCPLSASGSADELLLTLPIISGPDGIDPFIHPVPLRDPAAVDLASLKIAWYADVDGYLEPDEDTRATLDAALSALAERVGSVVQDTPSALAEYVDLWPRVGGGDGRAWVQRMLEQWGTTEESPFLTKGFERIEPTSTDVFTESLERQDQFRSEMLQFIQPYDAIIAPVAARPAPEHGGTYSSELRTMFYTGPYNIAGWPGTALRCGTSSDGLPIGVQILAHPWREDVTLALAAALEHDLGGWRRPPL